MRLKRFIKIKVQYDQENSSLESVKKKAADPFFNTSDLKMLYVVDFIRSILVSSFIVSLIVLCAKCSKQFDILWWRLVLAPDLKTSLNTDIFYVLSNFPIDQFN